MNKIVGSFYQLVAFSCVSVAVVGKAKHVKLRYEKIAGGSSCYFWSFPTNDKLIFSSVTSVTQATKNYQKATNNVLVQPSSSFYDVEQTTIIPGFQRKPIMTSMIWRECFVVISIWQLTAVKWKVKRTVQFTFFSFFDDNSKMFHSSTRISLSTFEIMTFSLKIMTQTLQKTLNWLLLPIEGLQEKTSKEDAKFDVVCASLRKCSL